MHTARTMEYMFDEWEGRSLFVKFWGEYACFTRPELKVERVSYDVPTPSAMRGMLEAIYWKPAIRYNILKIVVHNPINFLSIKRNEVKALAKTRGLGFGKEKQNRSDFFIEEKRTQRNSLVLKNVCYTVEFSISITDKAGKTREDGTSDIDDLFPSKHYGIFLNRAELGACATQPFLGTREFSASFELVKGIEQSALSGTVDLGLMLREINYEKQATSQWWRATMVDGTIEVPALTDPRVMQ